MRNRFTLLGRARLAQALLANAGPYDGKLDPLAASRKEGHGSPAAAGRFLADLYLQGDPAEEVSQALAGTAARLRADSKGEASAGVRELATRLTLLPEFQLA